MKDKKGRYPVAPKSGIVEFLISGGRTEQPYVLREGQQLEYTPSQIVESIQKGLPIRELDMLQQSLAIPIERLAPKLGISKATLHRRKAEGRLGSEESDRVVRFARLMGKAIEVFERQEAAQQWLDSPQVGLGGARPLDYAETEAGAREVDDLLGRIEYGVYA